MRKAAVLVLLLLCGCGGPFKKDLTYYAGLLPEEEAARYTEDYAGSSFSAYHFGFKAVELGIPVRSAYQEALAVAETRTEPEHYLANASLTAAVVREHLAAHIALWRRILRVVDTNFPVAAGHIDIEFERLGLVELGDELEAVLGEQLREFDPQRYPATHAVHAVITEMLELAHRPAGSLPDFERFVGGLSREFDSAFSAAVREQEAGGGRPRSYETTVLASLRRTSAERNHNEGLFTRLSAGAGSFAMDPGFSKTAEGASGTTSAELNAAFGGFIRPNLALHATVFGWMASDPEIEPAAGATAPSIDEFFLTGLGGGATYYFMPLNAYVSASAGFGSVEASGDDDWETDFGGFVGDLTVGKEWWWKDRWAIGAAFGVGYYSFPLDADADVSGMTTALRLSMTQN